MKKTFTPFLLSLLCFATSFKVHAQAPVINILTNTNAAPGYIFLATMHWNGGHPNDLLILDKEGNIVFDKKLPTDIDGNYLDFKPQPGNTYSFYNPKEGCFYILDKYFQFIDTIIAANGYATDGHELLVTENKHYLLLALEERIMDMSVLVSGGHDSAVIEGIVVQELDSNKNVVFEWKSLDHIPVTDCIGQNLKAAKIDFIHTNSIFIDSDSHLILSNRHLNEITKIHRTTGNVIWRMGKNSIGNQFTFTDDSMGFSYPHFARRLPNGNLTLFDNGNFRPNGVKFSRVCEYEINEVNKTAKLVWQYRNTPDNIATAMGSAQRLANGNTLIGWGNSYPNVTEVDSLGNKVFEISFPITSTLYTYRAFKYEMSHPVLNAHAPYGAGHDVIMYPNPGRGSFRISTGTEEQVEVSVYNMLGQLFIQKSIHTSESISGIPAGMYQVMISKEGSTSRQTLVVY